jgi:hypothetical protein
VKPKIWNAFQRKFVALCQNHFLSMTMLLMGYFLNFWIFIPCTTEEFILKHCLFLFIQISLRTVCAMTSMYYLTYYFLQSNSAQIFFFYIFISTFFFVFRDLEFLIQCFLYWFFSPYFFVFFVYCFLVYLYCSCVFVFVLSL